MKAFLAGIALMLAITVIAAVGFSFAPTSSSQIYQDKSSVRL